MTLISYSQNFEDVMLWRALKGVPNGFYIDVGAHDPVSGSVTKAFYDRGWRGINVEPIPAPFGLLQAARARDINLPICAGADDGEVDIYDVLPSGLATTQLSIAEEYRSAGHLVTVRRVPIKTLKSICSEHVKGEIHFLKIDVEGFEKEVLLGADFSEFRPWILVIEATRPNSPQVNYSEWENIVLNAGYRFAYFDGLNRFYVAVEHQDLISCFDTPPNYFDDFSLSSTCFFARQVTAELQQAEARVTAELQQAEARVVEVEARLTDILCSTSWRITQPLRRVRSQLMLLRQHGLAARTKALVKKIVLPLLQQVVFYVSARPKLRIRCVALARRLGFYEMLRLIVSRLSGQTNQADTHFLIQPTGSVKGTHGQLSLRAMNVYEDLKSVIEPGCEKNS